MSARSLNAHSPFLCAEQGRPITVRCNSSVQYHVTIKTRHSKKTIAETKIFIDAIPSQSPRCGKMGQISYRCTSSRPSPCDYHESLRKTSLSTSRRSTAQRCLQPTATNNSHEIITTQSPTYQQIFQPTQYRRIIRFHLTPQHRQTKPQQLNH